MSPVVYAVVVGAVMTLGGLLAASVGTYAIGGSRGDSLGSLYYIAYTL